MIKCDQCGKMFEIKNKLLKTTESEGIKKTVLICPECEAEYIVMIEDAEMRKMIYRRQEINEKIKEEIRAGRNPDKYRKTEEKIKKSLIKRRKMLIKRYGGRK